MKVSKPNFVVGIGASAGGLNAYKAFFDALASDTGMAFVVISHIHPAAHSQLAQILSRHTQMTVSLAASGMTVQANQIYVIPANADLSLESGVLKVISPRVRRNAQVDIFFPPLQWPWLSVRWALFFQATTAMVRRAASASRQQGEPPLHKTCLRRSVACL